MRLFNRKILKAIEPWLEKPDILVISGARQVGKTSLLEILTYVVKKKWGENKNILRINLEDRDKLSALNRDPKYFKEYLTLLGADTNKNSLVMIDEVQYLDDPSGFLKYMADFEPDIKLIVTGSSSMTIKRFKDSLAGRKKSFTLYPLDFREFLVFKKKRQLFDVLDTFNLSKILSIRDNEIEERIAPFMNEIQQLFEEYVLYGGYPKVVLTQSREEKLFELNELLMSYELKDVNVLFNIGNISAFRNLFKILASSVGNLLNVNELAGTIGIGRDTVLRYLSILENTFIIHQLPPFHGNIRKELTKMPKIFFMDTGLRNYALRSFSELEFRPDKGSLFENAIFGELYKNLGITDQLYFWRTISKIEVDFVLNSADKIAFEVKFNAGPGQNRSPGLKAFGKIYKDFKQIIVTYNKYSDGRIKLVPSWMISS